MHILGVMKNRESRPLTPRLQSAIINHFVLPYAPYVFHNSPSEVLK